MNEPYIIVDDTETTAQNETPSYEDALDKMLRWIEDNRLNTRDWTYRKRAALRVHGNGRKYDKIVNEDIMPDGSAAHTGVAFFVDKKTGAVIKAASWSQPEPKKHERANVYDSSTWKRFSEQGTPPYIK